VKTLARRLGVAHRTVRWRGAKPTSGLQEAARGARYRLLAHEAARAGCSHILTAHTLDDQAETLLFRLARGSGLTGLAGMAHLAPLPACGDSEILLVRPLLSVPKSRLVATLKSARIGYSDDPSNRDPRFTRPRLRALLPRLAAEGLDAKTLAQLGSRMRRADAAIEFAVGAARATLAPGPWRSGELIVLPARAFGELPHEVGLRLLGRAIADVGDEGPIELGKLEVVYDSLRVPAPQVRRTLAGALISLRDGKLTIERAPPRRAAAKRRIGNKTFKK
jgi:tRNA(Ile)-lysidine synthase